MAGAVNGLLSMVQGEQQAAALKYEASSQRSAANQEDFAAQQELLKGRTDALGIRQNLVQTLAAQNARYAGSGIALDAGAPATAAEVSVTNADAATTMATGNATLASEQRKLRATQLRDQAKYTASAATAARTAGYVKGSLTLIKDGESDARTAASLGSKAIALFGGGG